MFQEESEEEEESEEDENENDRRKMAAPAPSSRPTASRRHQIESAETDIWPFTSFVNSIPTFFRWRVR